MPLVLKRGNGQFTHSESSTSSFMHDSPIQMPILPLPRLILWDEGVIIKEHIPFMDLILCNLYQFIARQAAWTSRYQIAVNTLRHRQNTNQTWIAGLKGIRFVWEFWNITGQFATVIKRISLELNQKNGSVRVPLVIEQRLFQNHPLKSNTIMMGHFKSMFIHFHPCSSMFIHFP